MMTATHAMVGATLGGFIPSIPLVVVLNILIHFPMDRVPHYLPIEKSKLYIIMVVDSLLTLICLAAIWRYGGDTRYNMLAGAIAGAAIDFFLVLTPLLKTKIGQWHVSRQNHKHETKYYIVDLAVFALVFLFWWWVK